MMISTLSAQKRYRCLLSIFFVLLSAVCLLLYRNDDLRASLSLPSFTASPPTLNDLLHPQEQEKRGSTMFNSLA